MTKFKSMFMFALLLNVSCWRGLSLVVVWWEVGIYAYEVGALCAIRRSRHLTFFFLPQFRFELVKLRESSFGLIGSIHSHNQLIPCYKMKTNNSWDVVTFPALNSSELAKLKHIFHLSLQTFVRDLWKYECGFKIISCEVWHSHLQNYT